MTVAEIFETMDYGPAPESAKPTLEWIAQHDGRFGVFYGGEWHTTTAHFVTHNPATTQPLAEIAEASASDVDAAVLAAKNAQPAWEALGGHARARFLYAIARHIQKNARLFSVLETLDNGKPIRETRDIDIPLVVRHFYHHAGWAQLRESELPGATPLGVIGQIIPWNFPLLMLAWKIAPAIAMGNTVVLKPAEFTPLTALLFAEICQTVGLPPGVVNIITGAGETGAALVAHPEVAKIAFTGSTEVGRVIRKATAGSGKKISLELGGKSPFIVFEDADLDGVVEGIVDAIWFNQGQVCCAGSRLLVQESVAERLITKLKTRMDSLRIGDPLDKVIDIGAIVADVQLRRITELVDQGVREGATLYQSPSVACPKDGYFYPPTLLTGVAPASVVAQEEIFGPVLVVIPFRTPAEAVLIANNTRYGLAASVWSESINQCLEIAPKLKCGTVWINSTNHFDAAAGFGGYRESGYGREGGKEGLWEYVQLPTKYVTETAISPSNTPLPTTVPTIDQTAKLYIGGKQARPDSGYSLTVTNAAGVRIGEVGDGSRKDIRNAVEAARAAASSWGGASGHNRAQILYYLAENLEYRAAEFATRITQLTGLDGSAEVAASIEQLFFWAAKADKNDGAAHRTAQRSVTLAMPEPVGVIGIACPDAEPLLGLIRWLAPAVALGNSVIAVPSERFPLAATDLYQVLETSDVPSGVVNIITGKRDVLAETLAAHDDIEAVWYFGSAAGSAHVEALSVGNMKRTWVDHGTPFVPTPEQLCYHATQIKNIWIPYTDEVSW